MSRGARFPVHALDAKAILCYKPVAPMSDRSHRIARSTLADYGLLYAPFYAWRFS